MNNGAKQLLKEQIGIILSWTSWRKWLLETVNQLDDGDMMMMMVTNSL
jgi:hypothetical protein